MARWKLVTFIFTLYDTTESALDEMPYVHRTVKTLMSSGVPMSIFMTHYDDIITIGEDHQSVYHKKPITKVFKEYVVRETSNRSTKYIFFIISHSWVFYIHIKGVTTCHKSKCVNNVVTVQYFNRLFKKCNVRPDIIVLDSCVTSTYEVLKHLYLCTDYLILRESYAYNESGMFTECFFKCIRSARTHDTSEMAHRLTNCQIRNIKTSNVKPQDVTLIKCELVAILLEYLKNIRFKHIDYDDQVAVYKEWGVYDIYSALQSVLRADKFKIFKKIYRGIVLRYYNNKPNRKLHGISFIAKNYKGYKEYYLYYKLATY